MITADADEDKSDSDLECERLQEACDAVASDRRNADIIICPPSTVDAVSDQEQVDEDELSPSSLPTDVPGTLIVHFESKDDGDDSAGDSQEKPKKRGRKSIDKKKGTCYPKWKDVSSYKKVIGSNEILSLSTSHPELASKTPIELFKLYYDDNIRHLITTESMRYARQKNHQTFDLDDSSLDVFIGILILSGYHSLPRERLYWCRDEDVEVNFVSKHMSRNRFEEIKRFLHVANNDDADTNDKLYKIRPILDATNKNLQQFGIFSKYLSIDEEMVPYFGHHSAKMFMRSKPVRFGYKLWVMASDSGYPYHVQVYCGKNKSGADQMEQFGLGHRVVTSLLAIVDDPLKHEVFFDNFFTSYDLLAYLQKENIKATGTVRENRLKKCPLIDNRAMRKTERGTFDTKSDGVVSVVKWHDNQCVTVATNYDTLASVGKVRRWSAAKKTSVDVQQPTVVTNYNLHMGGVDLLDSFMANYRPAFRSKKWWWPLLMNSINMMVVASWRLHVECGGSFDQLNFRRYIVRVLMQSPTQRAPLTGPGTIPMAEIRTDGIDHHLVTADKQRRCKMCTKNARLMCVKCNVALHLHCEQEFHS